jgi:hypothetical protein
MSYTGTEDFKTTLAHATLSFRIMKLENGLLVMISDSDAFRLGPSAVSVPSGQLRREPTSMVVSGVGQDLMIVRSIAERISAWTNSMCMLIVAVKNINRELMLEIVNVLKSHLVT